MSSNSLRPPPRPRSPGGSRSGTNVSQASHRSTSSLSNASTESHVGELAMHKRNPYQPTSASRPATAGGPSASTSSLQNFSRPTPRGSMEGMRVSSPPSVSSMRVSSPPISGAHLGHRARQHSQGFFEPSLPHTSTVNVPTLGSLSASQIAAQAAMHHVQSGHQQQQQQQQQHQERERKRSGGSLAPINTAASNNGRRVPSPIHIVPAGQNIGNGQLPYSNGTLGGRHLAATTAANAAFPRSPLPSPNPQTAEQMPTSPFPEVRNAAPSSQPPAQEAKTKERSKMNMNMNMKLFSKPKNIATAKGDDKKYPSLPSPRGGILKPSFANASTTSLAEPFGSSGASSLYSSANPSTSTLVPATGLGIEKEKDKHRHHHFLSRQKQKLKESAEHRNLPLSSASSNSQAVDPSAPQSLYSFAPAPSSPGFSKSVSGLDLRHGGRALREKKKEEKAAAAASASSSGLTQIMSNSSANLSRYDDSRSDYVGPSSLDSASLLGPPTNMSTNLFSFSSLEQTPTLSAVAFNQLGATMGLSGLTPDDAWPLLKAKLLNIFEGEDLRTPIEDFNLLVSVHIRRCIQKRAPIVLVEDLRELLVTGFSSLSQTLRGVPDERLVLKLVDIWSTVFGTILPFIQAVFLPLDNEFRGNGPIMSQREALEFWGSFISDDTFSKADERPSSAGGVVRLPSLGQELDVRRITLIVFRDVVVLPKNDSLMAIFSRLSLDSIKTEPSPAAISSPPQDFRHRGLSNPATTGAERPSTGGSLSPRLSSFNSQTSTLLDAASTTSSGGNASQTHSRSRATSNTSAGSFGTSLPHLPSPLSQPPMPISSFPIPASFPAAPQPSPPVPIADPAQVTETVARMLQCVSVLAGCQTGDHGQGIVEKLTQALKYNWLGRGRTGRQRRGWVGMKVGGRGARPAGMVGA